MDLNYINDFVFFFPESLNLLSVHIVQAQLPRYLPHINRVAGSSVSFETHTTLD